MPATPLTRRAALGAGVAGVLLAPACGQESPRRPASTGDPDTSLVDEVVAEITATAALAGRVPALTTMHAAHLAALQADPPAAGTAPRTQLRRAERDLQTYLAEAAVRAESGPLARLLASMSASVAQHVAALEAS